MALFSKLCWWSNFRNSSKGNAIGLAGGALVSACLYYAQTKGIIHVQPEAIDGIGLTISWLLTQIYIVLVKEFPSLEKIEMSVEDIENKIPVIEQDYPKDKSTTLSDSVGPSNGNYNKK